MVLLKYPAILLLVLCTKEFKMSTQILVHVHASIINNSLKVETTQRYINK
jgi:hypothetical protein